MITTSDKDRGYLELEAYGLNEERMQSLRALAPVWQSSLVTVAPILQGGAEVEAFIRLSGELPTSISDVIWQRNWMQSWHRLQGRGFALSEIFQFFFRALELCEADVYGDRSQISRLHLDLIGILRRAILAAVSCAVELGEQARDAESGVPGELTALRSLHELSREQASIAVLSLSLANRDSFSHLSAADLQSLPGLLAERLQTLLRPSDKVFVGREGEWLMVLTGVNSMAQPSLAAAHVQRSFSAPVRLFSGRSLMLDVMIGAAMMPEHGTDPDAVLQAARLARWSLVASGQQFGWYHEGLSQDWRKRFEMVDELRKALHHETLECYLQPQVDLDSGACVGAEMLLRWQRGNGEWVPPPMIMELIEENGWRSMLTDWLLRSAMRTCADLMAAGVDITVSLNLTAADLLDDDLPELISQRLETWQLPADRFTLELTESAMLTDPTRCLSNMHRLRALGLRLALDDFGTGYSSLSYLVSLPVQEIKIDRAFVIAMSESIDSLRLVRSIIDLTRDLEMVPLAEGIETVPQRDQLWALGCKLGQGYHYAKPMPVADFIEWYQQRQA